MHTLIFGGEGDGGGGGEQPRAHVHSFLRAEGDGWWWQQTTPPSKTSVRARGGRWLVVAGVNNTPPKMSVRARGGKWPRWVVVAVTNNMPPLITSTFARFLEWHVMGGARWWWWQWQTTCHPRKRSHSLVFEGGGKCVLVSKKERNLTSVSYMLVLRHSF